MNRKIIIIAAVGVIACTTTGFIIHNQLKADDIVPESSSVPPTPTEVSKSSFSIDLPVGKSLSAEGVLKTLGEENGGISTVSFKNSEVNVFDLSSIDGTDYGVVFSNGNAYMVFRELGDFSEVLGVSVDGDLIAEITIKGNVFDSVPPTFEGVRDIVVTEGIDFDAREGVSVVDNCDKELDFEVLGVVSDVGEHDLVYVAVDSSGNRAEAHAKLVVQPAEENPVPTDPVVVAPITGNTGGTSGGKVSKPAQPQPPAQTQPPANTVDWRDPWSEVDCVGGRHDTPPADYSEQEKAWFNYAYNACKAYGKTPSMSANLASSYVSACRSKGEENVVLGDPVGVGWTVWRYRPELNVWEVGD